MPKPFPSKSGVHNPSYFVPIIPKYTHCLLDCHSHLSCSRNFGQALNLLRLQVQMTSIPMFLKSSAKFNLSFSFGHLPSAWKTANITPIYKTGTKTKETNYIPVILLPITSKVMKSMIPSDVISFLFSKSGLLPLVWILSQSQLWACFLTSLSNVQVRTVSMDISWEFNRVWHPVVLAKLSHLQQRRPSSFLDF